ncbi:hypothetical protein EDD86DRAFT_265939 [Gorgonomyces haynaldii]|nr:hypothetical protein EDD86DRAFT_265939 [Gorgonomyces haynaldii]
MKNVGQELTHTQALYDAKNRQIETEDHLKQLAEREAGRLNLEIKRVGTSIADMNEYLNMLQASIYRGNERIEVIRTELKLESDELNEWIRVQSEKEEDNRVLLKYSKEDEAKIKDLNHMIEKLMIEVNKRKAALNAEVTETQVAQIELDRTTEAFKQLHQERQDLINQWQEAVNSMQKRDEDIIHAQDALSQLKAHMQDTQNMIKEREETYNSQLTANKEVEKKITAEERLVAKFRYSI